MLTTLEPRTVVSGDDVAIRATRGRSRWGLFGAISFLFAAVTCFVFRRRRPSVADSLRRWKGTKEDANIMRQVMDPTSNVGKPKLRAGAALRG